MNKLKSALANRTLRAMLVVVIVGATIALFAQYIAKNPDVLATLVSLSPLTIAVLALAYVGTILANALVLKASLRLMNKRVSFTENLNLTGYSSIVNFFGPLQSGPGFRAAYLKQKHSVSLQKFLYTTILFYAFFAAINGLVIGASLLATLPGGTGILLGAAGALLGVGVVWAAYRYVPSIKSAARLIKVTSASFWTIGAGALLLSACTTLAYFVELLHVDSSINLLQTIVYAAAANLALFVSLTPGAIGFRESFLLLSERLHQIPADVVIAASIIDRAFYVVFLLVLFGLLLAFGVRSKLTRAQSKK